MLDSGKGMTVKFINQDGVILQVFTTAIPSDMTAEVYSLALQEARYQLLSGYQLVSDTETTAGALTAEELQFTATTGIGHSDQAYLVVVVKQGSQAHVLEAIGAPIVFGQHEEEIRKLIDSFTP